MQKRYIWNPATCSCKNGKYVDSIISDSPVLCDEIIDTIKTTSTKSISTKAVLTKFTSKNVYVLLTFLLITIALLVAASLWCYLIKYQAKLNLYNLSITTLPN